jgi:F0F1-type ATP synthase assembly protein I
MNTDAAYYRLALRIFADFSGSIAIPAVLGVLAGKWLDNKQGSEPFFLIIFLLLAFFLSAWGLVKKAKMYQRAYDALNTKN